MKFNKTTFRLSRYHDLTTKELKSQSIRLFLFKKTRLHFTLIAKKSKKKKIIHIALYCKI